VSALGVGVIYTITMMLGIKKRRSSFWVGFGWAYQGLQDTFKREVNFRIQLAVGLVVVGFGWYFRLSANEWLVLILTIFLVLAAELFNTAIENLVDLHITKIHPAAKLAKDASAGAVLILSLMAVLVGLIIFLPKLG